MALLRERRSRIPITLAILATASVLPLCAGGAEWHVAPGGDDSWSGRVPTPNADRTDGPFQTLERARDAVRAGRSSGDVTQGATVWLHDGTYRLSRLWTLTAEDSGTAEVPITYRAAPGARPILSGGQAVTGFEPVTSPAEVQRLAPEARESVLRADLARSGITDHGRPVGAGTRAELFVDDRAMTLARWPNEGFVTIAKVTGPEPFEERGTRGNRIGQFTYENNRPQRWMAEPDVWLHGYWFYDWSDSYQKIAAIDPARHEITLAAPHHGYGYRAGQRYYALNALSELDAPGEWYLDRDAGIVYLWPPEGADLASRPPVLSIRSSLVEMKDVSHLTLRGLTFEHARGTALNIQGGRGVTIAGCTIRNVGSWGLRVAGTDHAVVGCDILQTGAGGISLDGGDRASLTPGNLLAENNHIAGFGRIERTYRPAVAVEGVGHRVRHNVIHDGPHNAIQLSGNDHQIEFNEIFDVCYETGDVGAFYTGRDWTARGTVIRHNHFHDIAGPGLYGAMAVYLDDAASGFTIAGNLFERAGRAAFIGGGRDNQVLNNVFVDCEVAVHVDARGLGWMRDHVEPGGTLPERLKAVSYKEPPWSERYPELPGILDDDPGAPKRNRVERNLCVGGRWTEIEDKAEPHVTLRDNLVDVDPHFIAPEHGDYRLRDDSPAFAIGFVPIPFDRIGLQRDDLRASWPVEAPRRPRTSGR